MMPKTLDEWTTYLWHNPPDTEMSFRTALSAFREQQVASELASLRAQLAEAERRAAIDQRQCDEMTSEAGRLASLLREAERDAGRWRAVRPLLNATTEPQSLFTWLHTETTHEGVGLTVEQIVDAIAQREERK